jgi:hypothetical protein
MKKILLIFALISITAFSIAQDKTGNIRKGTNSLAWPFKFTAADSIAGHGGFHIIANQTYWVRIINIQKYMQYQTLTVTLDNISGTTDVVCTAYGKTTLAGDSATIGTPVTLSADGTATITATTPYNYNYLSLYLVAGAGTQNSHITALTVRTANAFEVGGTGLVTASNGLKIPNDQILTLGTTTTNAETKITAKFDETTSGIGQFRIGDMTYPQVLKVNPGATVAGSIININHTLGAGNCDDLLGSYSKVNVLGSGDAGITIVGDAPRAYVGLTGGSNNSVASQAYASQPWARHQGTGAITAMSGLSAKLDVGADNFTASTINAGHFHIDGAATVTGQFDGVMVEVYPDVASMDNAIKIAVDAGATVVNGIGISGTVTHDIMGQNGEYLDNTTNGSFTIPNIIRKHTPVTVNATETTSAANMLAGVIKCTSTSAVAITTPTATAIAALIPGCGAGTAFDLIIDNSASSSSGAVTLTLDGSIAVVNPAIITGGATLTLAVGTTGKFSFYFTSGTAAKCYRVY